jgi:SAM-dependent methyltransferase
MPDLARLHETWESLGQTDPLWAILSTEETRGNHWDLATFFQTGEDEVERLFYLLKGLDISFSRGRALDFGCGVGRVTQALATRFDSVDGVDIAASMIRRASEYNRHQDRCTYHVNASSDLRLFKTSTFDVVYALDAVGLPTSNTLDMPADGCRQSRFLTKSDGAVGHVGEQDAHGHIDKRRRAIGAGQRAALDVEAIPTDSIKRALVVIPTIS